VRKALCSIVGVNPNDVVASVIAIMTDDGAIPL